MPDRPRTTLTGTVLGPSDARGLVRCDAVRLGWPIEGDHPGGPRCARAAPSCPAWIVDRLARAPRVGEELAGRTERDVWIARRRAA